MLWGVSVLLAAQTVPAVGFQNGQSWETLTIEGSRFPPEFRVAVGDLVLLRMSNGVVEKIPFQIDERDRHGQLALPQGPVPSQDETPGIFDDNDLLVFAARDLGERANIEHAVEIKVTDALTGENGWAYLQVDPGASGASATRDVRYDPSTDSIHARRYTLAFGPHTTSYFAFVGPDGQPGRNLLDRVKARGTAHVLWGMLNFHRTEDDVTNTVLAWKEGPVRVVRRSQMRVRLGYGLPPLEMIAEDTFTADVFEGPAAVRIPFDLRYVFGDLTLRLFLDFDNLRGYSIFSADHAPVPLACGIPTPDLNGWYADWFGMSGPEGTFVHALRVGPALQTVQRRLYVVADSKPDPPERAPGDCPGVGYQLTHWGGIRRGTYRVDMVVRAFEQFRSGDEQVFLYTLDHPPVVTINPSDPFEVKTLGDHP